MLIIACFCGKMRLLEEKCFLLFYGKGEDNMLHTMGLQEKYYNLIQYGTKEYEIRLNDEKRQKMNNGDFIAFQKEPERKDTFLVEIADKEYYQNFQELFHFISIDKLADKSASEESLLSDLEKFYPIEQQKEYGTVAIKLNKNNMIYKGSIEDVSLHNPVFLSLKDMYDNFDEWLEKLKKKEYQFYYTKNDNEVSSVLILKLNETDSQQFLQNGNIMKVRSLMVKDNRHGIGSRYMKLIDDIAKLNHIQYIYMAIQKENEELINFIKKYDYRLDSEYQDEYVFVKELA